MFVSAWIPHWFQPQNRFRTWTTSVSIFASEYSFVVRINQLNNTLKWHSYPYSLNSMFWSQARIHAEILIKIYNCLSIAFRQSAVTSSSYFSVTFLLQSTFCNRNFFFLCWCWWMANIVAKQFFLWQSCNAAISLNNLFDVELSVFVQIMSIVTHFASVLGRWGTWVVTAFKRGRS